MHKQILQKGGELPGSQTRADTHDSANHVLQMTITASGSLTSGVSTNCQELLFVGSMGTS